MYAPKLYRVNKLPLTYIIDCEYNVTEAKEEQNKYSVLQQDNSMFRQIRLVTNDCTGIYVPHIIFVDINGCGNKEDALREVVLHGFTFNERRYVISERSASMTRQGMLSFIDARISEQVHEAVGMGLAVGGAGSNTVLSKWYAYRGLMLSSCHCIEGWVPKIIVCRDAYGVIRNQHIRYVVDEEVDFIDKEGNARKWKQKEITEGVKDIEINLFDGCGVHHPDISLRLWEELVKLGATGDAKRKTDVNRHDDVEDEVPTSYLLRAPFLKGMSHEVDYESFYAERGVEFIQDIWGVWHDVRPGSTPMMIMNESMYKGYKYFKRHGDSRDWDDYWDRFYRYGHCLGIVKWNYTTEQEEVYRRGNYQILQDLDLPYEDFKTLAEYTVDWIEQLASGDWGYVSCFLGLLAGRKVAATDYVRAILKNPLMVREPGVRKYLINTLKKYINDMKSGKIYLRACSKYLVPDLIMLLEHVGGLELRGCLAEDEFWTRNAAGGYAVGEEYLIERNPHLSASEHALLKYVDNDYEGLIKRHLGHLANVAMVNCKSLIAQRLNGADMDGDTVLVVDESMMKQGVDREAAIVIDIEDKIAAMKQEDTPENKFQIIKLGMHGLIGETSNAATTYHNKMPQTQKQKDKYNRYVALLSVINGKVIDAAKTGVLFKIPRHIAKYSKPLPYFMKYAGDYYARQKQRLKSQSNMNRLAWDIEKWETGVKWGLGMNWHSGEKEKRMRKKFDYSIMLDEAVGVEEALVPILVNIYKAYNKELTELKKTSFGYSVNWSGRIGLH